MAGGSTRIRLRPVVGTERVWMGDDIDPRLEVEPGDALDASLRWVAHVDDPAHRRRLALRAVTTAVRTGGVHRLKSHADLLTDLDDAILDLVDAADALHSGDRRGAEVLLDGVVGSALRLDAEAVVLAAQVAADAAVQAASSASWADAVVGIDRTTRLLERLDDLTEDSARSDGRSREDVLTGIRFDLRGVSALVEFHTSRAPSAPSAALEALTSALAPARSARMLGAVHGFALLAQGSVLDGRRELRGAASSLSAALPLLAPARPGLARWARAELALVRARQGRWEEARILAEQLAEPSEVDAVPDHLAPAVQAVMAALGGRLGESLRLARSVPTSAPHPIPFIASTLASHALVAGSIGRNDWAALHDTLDDIEQQQHRTVFDETEWTALRALALWHLDRLDEYRTLHARWARSAVADSAYCLIHSAILARIDGQTAETLRLTQLAVDALDRDYDPLGRTWVRIVAGTHVSLLGDPVEGLTHYEDARAELLTLGAEGFAALCTGIIRSTSDALAERSGDVLAALTDQQRRVAQLVAEGHTSAEIGGMLHLSRKTIDFHVANILVRLDLRTRREITRMLRAERPGG
ncbi:LuxR C-terminal-related transcriptional regulator [Cnuibacter physcomitrellae]|uniref:LuxR C-terminal-related transcriptional regulator n=1 Tax=Cnuibacter physcomitrellae TaxID=1619308 RepID=UPI002175DCE2|nr:LuxR C-terminal-related transcriptional regulator [Cnuibacter physcomitrellae]MCS5499423.1 LuxR C-terminal-related transcriptional regulator [Cnuibacter physcomitrellae]